MNGPYSQSGLGGMPWREDPERVTYFAETDSRNQRLRFGIKAKDRSRHMYVIGKTGMGKSTMLENLAVQDIQNGEGLTFIDPHGSTAEKLLDYVPEHRIKDVLYFAPFDLDYPISFNVLEKVDSDKRHLVTNGLMSTFEKIWVDAWSARMAYILQNTLMALLEYPEATLLGVNRMYTDKEYRKQVISNVTDPSVKAFWTEEFAKYTDRYMQEATPAIQNKIGQFSSTALVRNIIGQPQSSFDPRKIMDERKIFIVNLSKGKVGEGNANLLGSMLITKLYLAAMSRADVAGSALKNLPPHYLYVDEFQNFANKSFADILSEARKYKLALTIAHQYVEQMEEEVRDAVFGNVGTTVSFRVGAFDSETLEKEFAPIFAATDLVNLGFAQVYLKLMIDGVSSTPFSATTLSPIAEPHISHRDQIIAASRAQFARPRADVEEEIRKWHEPLEPTPKTEKEIADEKEKKDSGKGGFRAAAGKGAEWRGGGGDRPPRENGERREAPQPREKTSEELRAVLAGIAGAATQKRTTPEPARNPEPRAEVRTEAPRPPREPHIQPRPQSEQQFRSGPLREHQPPREQQQPRQNMPIGMRADDKKGMTEKDRLTLKDALAGVLNANAAQAPRENASHAPRTERNQHRSNGRPRPQHEQRRPQQGGQHPPRLEQKRVDEDEVLQFERYGDEGDIDRSRNRGTLESDLDTNEISKEDLNDMLHVDDDDYRDWRERR